MHRHIVLKILLSLLVSANVFAAEKEIRLSLGITPTSLIFNKIKDPFEKETGIKLVYTAKDPAGHGSDYVFKDLDQGKADVGSGAIYWTDWQALMKEKGYEVKDPDRFKVQVIGKDTTYFATWKGGPKKLSREQIIGILDGSTKNWKQIGGGDLPVKLFMFDQAATNNFVKKVFLGKTDFRTDQREDTKSIGEMVESISKTPGAIGFAPQGMLNKTVNIPDQPKTVRPITFLTVGKPSKEVEQLYSFIRKNAKKYDIPME